MWSDSDNTAPLAVMPADTSRSRRRRGCVPAGRVDRDNANNHVGRVRADVAGRPARCRRAAAFWDATESRGWSPLRATVVVIVVPAGWFAHASLGLSLGFRPEADDCDAHPGRLAAPGAMNVMPKASRADLLMFGRPGPILTDVSARGAVASQPPPAAQACLGQVARCRRLPWPGERQ